MKFIVGKIFSYQPSTAETSFTKHPWINPMENRCQTLPESCGTTPWTITTHSYNSQMDDSQVSEEKKRKTAKIEVKIKSLSHMFPIKKCGCYIFLGGFSEEQILMSSWCSIPVLPFSIPMFHIFPSKKLGVPLIFYNSSRLVPSKNTRLSRFSGNRMFGKLKLLAPNCCPFSYGYNHSPVHRSIYVPDGCASQSASDV